MNFGIGELNRLLLVIQSLRWGWLQCVEICEVVHKFVISANEEDRNQEAEIKEFVSETENLLHFFPDISSKSSDVLRSFHDFAINNSIGVGTLLIPQTQNCRKCIKPLKQNNQLKTVVVYHATHGTILGSRLSKQCPSCKISEHHGYWTEGNVRHLDLQQFHSDFVQISEETAVHVGLIKEFISLLIVGAIPFSTYCKAYNRRFEYTLKHEQGENTKNTPKRPKKDTSENLRKLLCHRQRLDRRRFEEAFLSYACCEVILKFGLDMLELPPDDDDMLQPLCERFYEEFTAKWGDHRCNTKGCTDVIVIDGNMKNARQVCKCSKTGFFNFKGLKDKVVTGCPNTPKLAKRYCSSHIGFTVPFRNDEEGAKKEPMEDHPLMVDIIGDKTTRQGRIYQVKWSDGRTSWLKQSNLPEYLKTYIIENASLDHSVVHIKELGQERTEIKISKSTLKSDMSSSSIGKFTSESLITTIKEEEARVLQEEIAIMKCGTEKGRHKCKNSKTAGILVFEKPCGIVIDIKELYGSESKSQVYGHLHDLLQRDSQKQCKVICYDDACHLKKFSMKPSRSEWNETTKRMAELTYVCDRFHFKNHTDSWCIANCNPYKCENLKGVNTEVCEQLFSWLSKFSHITKHMNRWRFVFLMLYVLDQHNEDIIAQTGAKCEEDE